MVSYLDPSLQPRSGRELKVLLVQRVSSPGPGKQSLTSLDDQGDIQRRWLAKHTDLPLDITVLSGSGSGEDLSRRELLELLDLIESEEFDLVLVEDLGRIARRVKAMEVCELCEDHGVRLIAINNAGVDTAKEGWRDTAFFTAYFYEKDNRDKSNRLKGRLRSRFLDGGALPRLIAGYIKPDGAKHEDEVSKDPLWEPIYAEWFRKLDEDDASFAQIAEWLNEIGAPVGPYSRTKTEWDGTTVGKYTRNPLLKGLRVHNDRRTRRINSTGKYKSEKAPPEHRLEREVPHLAFIEPAYYDQVLAKVNQRNEKYRRSKSENDDPLTNRPKRRTRFPGQIIECGICGRGYVFGGHGQTEHLMCNGAREYKCWNGFTVDGPVAAEKISDAVFLEIEAFVGFDEAFLEILRERADALAGGRESEERRIASKLQRCQRELANLVAYVASGNASETVAQQITERERQKAQLEYQATELQRRADSEFVIPSAEEIKELARASIRDLALDSFEFSNVMRQLIPKIVVWPVQSCQGGKVYMRSKFKFQIANLLADANTRELLAEQLERVLSVDLFEPSQFILHRERIMELRSSINPKTGRKYTERQAANVVGITHTAAQRAAKLQRAMDDLGLVDPMIQITEPPANNGRYKRHKHPRYSFDPLPGAGEL